MEVSGAAAVAAVLAGKVGAAEGQRVVCTVSGETSVVWHARCLCQWLCACRWEEVWRRREKH